MNEPTPLEKKEEDEDDDEKLFKCAVCGGTFEKNRSDEEAMAETHEYWSDINQEDCEIACDDCYQMIRPENNPEIYQKTKKFYNVGLKGEIRGVGKMKNQNRIIIGVWSGSATIISAPPDLEIEIRDYDTESIPEDRLLTDESGDKYFLEELIIPSEDNQHETR